MVQLKRQRDNPDVKPITLGLTALEFLRGAKVVRRFLHSQLWVWKGRKVLLLKQLEACERRSIKAAKIAHNAALKTMEKMAHSPRSSKTKADRKKGPKPEMSVQEKRAVEVLEAGVPEPLGRPYIEDVAQRMFLYYKESQKAHVRQWIQDVAVFDEAAFPEPTAAVCFLSGSCLLIWKLPANPLCHVARS